MKNYISRCIDEFINEEPDEIMIMRPVNTPAANYLFRVSNVEKISKRRVGLFRARPDVLLTVSFFDYKS
jgi:hypothetical protein